MKKRKHHHVWAYYLQPWAPDGLIWCSTRDRIFSSGLDGVANRRDFYLLEPLSEKELLLAKQIMGFDATPKHVQAINAEWFETLHLFSTIGHIVKEKMADRRGGVDVITELTHNFGENLHERVESSFKAHLDSLRAKDTSFYLHNMESVDFLHSLCIQMTRTVAFRQAIMDAIHVVEGIEGQSLAKVLAFVFAGNISWVLYAERRHRNLILIQNDTTIPFITGDQPVVNLLALDTQPGEEPTELEVYYPLGPDLAMVITAPHDRRRGTLSASRQMVEAMNRCIQQSSHEQLYADGRSTLAELNSRG